MSLGKLNHFQAAVSNIALKNENDEGLMPFGAAPRTELLLSLSLNFLPATLLTLQAGHCLFSFQTQTSRETSHQ